jgi:DNA-binding response OmpR family regulator
MRLFHVLMAHTDPMLLAACRLFLVGEEVHLTAVADAAAARAALDHDPPDLLVLDSELPGLDLEKWLPRGNSDGPQLILIVRREALPDDLPRGSRVAVLLEPVSPALLALIVGTIARSPHFAGAAEA